MNDDLKHMLKIDAAMQLGNSLGSVGASVHQFLSFQEAQERERNTARAFGYDSIEHLTDSLHGMSGGTIAAFDQERQLENAQKAIAAISGATSISRRYEATYPTGLENIGELWRCKELEERQQMIDRAIGKMNALPATMQDYVSSSAAAQQVAMMTGSGAWGGMKEVLPAHLQFVLSGLPENFEFTRFGSISTQALAAVALEESAGLAAARREALRVQNAADSIAGLFEREQVLRMAGQSEIAALAAQAILADRLTGYAFGDSAGILQSRMGAMDGPWMNSAASLASVTAFAHVQAMGDLIQSAPPYAPAVSAWLRTDMGDWRDDFTLSAGLHEASARTAKYLEQGFDEGIALTPQRVIVRSAAIARLFESDDPFAEDWLGVSDDEVAMARLAFERLLRFELALRNFICALMTSSFGENWMRAQLPNGMLDEWKSRQAIAVKAGKARDDLIAYADFTDYLKIIERKDNWRQVFCTVFGRQEDVRESLQRLYPLRLSAMHARFVTTADLVLLWSETTRVVSAFSRAGGEALPH